MTQVRNVNDREVQVDLTASVGLDVDAFKDALDNGSARSEFEDDVSRTRAAGVRAFPTYRINGPKGSRTIVGFRSFGELETAVTAVDASLERSSPPPVAEFVSRFEPVATQEIAEVYELEGSKAKQVLHSLVDAGTLRRKKRVNRFFWLTRDS